MSKVSLQILCQGSFHIIFWFKDNAYNLFICWMQRDPAIENSKHHLKPYRKQQASIDRQLLLCSSFDLKISATLESWTARYVFWIPSIDALFIAQIKLFTAANPHPPPTAVNVLQTWVPLPNMGQFFLLLLLGFPIYKQYSKAKCDI